MARKMCWQYPMDWQNGSLKSIVIFFLTGIPTRSPVAETWVICIQQLNSNDRTALKNSEIFSELKRELQFFRNLWALIRRKVFLRRKQYIWVYRGRQRAQRKRICQDVLEIKDSRLTPDIVLYLTGKITTGLVRQKNLLG